MGSPPWIVSKQVRKILDTTSLQWFVRDRSDPANPVVKGERCQIIFPGDFRTRFAAVVQLNDLMFECVGKISF